MGNKAIDVLDKTGIVATFYPDVYDYHKRTIRLFNDSWTRKVICEYELKDGEWWIEREATENEEVIKKVLNWDKSKLDVLANTIRMLE